MFSSMAYAAPAPTAQPMQGGPSVYGSQFEVYKGKAAVQFKPIGCTFGEVEGGVEIKRKGVLLMELANAVGTRSYDWSNKITFALSVTEMAQLFLTNSVLSGNTVDFFHDPSMGVPSAQGQVVKSLKAGLMPDQINVGILVSEKASGANRSVSVQLSAAEFLVCAEMCRYLIPRALGMERLF